MPIHRLLAAVTLLSALLAGQLGAAEGARIVRGPWMWFASDGAPQLGIALAGTLVPPADALLDGAEIAIRGELHDLADHTDGADHVLVLRLAAGLSGRLRVQVAGESVSARLQRPPATDGPARVALASGRAWPDRTGLASLAKALDGEVQLVIALGNDVPLRLGTGGWESETPLVVVAPPNPDLSACTNGLDERWRHGLSVGVLGLPASPDRGRADLALARDLSPWLVYLDVPAGWDPAIGQHHPSDPRDLGVLLAACQRLSVPLAIGAGAAGLISEPLRLQTGGMVDIVRDGVRYALPVPATDDGLARISPAAALALEQPLLSGLGAELARLRLVMVRPGENDAVQLVWKRGDDGHDDDAADLAKTVTTAETLDAPAIRDAMRRWSWLPRSELAAAMPDVETIVRLRDEGGAQGRALARRLTLIAADDPTISALPGDPDPMALREQLLWKIGTVRGADSASWRLQASSSVDPLVLRALLADVTRDPERQLLPTLVERVRLQAAGELPLDPDPLDQHRLFSIVFDDVRLSPTPLRPYAVALREKADPLARGPIERFIARHGVERPVE
jgi:hypothetical protein